jgi:hypothetical protein
MRRLLFAALLVPIAGCAIEPLDCDISVAGIRDCHAASRRHERVAPQPELIEPQTLPGYAPAYEPYSLHRREWTTEDR